VNLKFCWPCTVIYQYNRNNKSSTPNLLATNRHNTHTKHTNCCTYRASWWWAKKCLKHVEAINRNKLKANSASCRSYYTDILESGYLKNSVTDTISSTPVHYLLHHTTICFGSPTQLSLHISCSFTTFLKLFYPEDKRTTIFRNICTYLPAHKSKHQEKGFCLWICLLREYVKTLRNMWMCFCIVWRKGTCRVDVIA
jgi:hypothetical protein